MKRSRRPGKRSKTAPQSTPIEEPLEQPLEVLSIESLDLEGRGIARRDGKTLFVENALPGETVQARITKVKPRYEMAETVQVLKAANERVEPHCAHYGHCGGCAMQHLAVDAQVAVKQRVLEDAFTHIAKLKIPCILPPIQGASWHYRYRARLGVRYIERLGKVLIGFHERKSSYIADIEDCQVLPIGHLLLPLRTLIASLSCYDRIPQLELAMGEHATVLSLRHLRPLTAQDKDKLRAFAQQHQIQWWLQPAGPDSVHPLEPQDSADLYYRLAAFNLKMPYVPTDFTQVNHQLNQIMVQKAIQRLKVQPGERILDLFCGLGNFTLPMATLGAQVVGVEGSQALVTRAKTNAQHCQGLKHMPRYQVCNLFEVDAEWFQKLGYFDKLLIDPPRDGALAVSKALSALPSEARPRRIVYVSCNPATLARDVSVLVNVGGYHLRSAGVMNMFPHTAHVESMAILTWNPEEKA